MSVVKVLHLVVDVECKVDVMSQDVFTLGYIHVLEFGDVSF
jgi:hypothetical protein